MPRVSIIAKTVAAACLACVAAPAAAVDWTYLGREGEGLHHYIDADSLNRRGSVAAFWTMTVRGQPDKGGEVIERLGSAHCTDYAYKVIEERRNPKTRLRQPTWVVAFRSAWRTFEPSQKVPERSPLRAIIDMACGTAEIGSVAFALPAPPAPPKPPLETVAREPAPPEEPIAKADPPAAAEPPARPAAWVDLGASVTGQAILVDAASVTDEASPTGWFQLLNPDDEDPLPVSYLLRVDCKRRTITQLGLRKYDEAGRLAEERNYGPDGEGPMEIEAETVMEVAFLNLCTGEGVDGVRRLAGLAPAGDGSMVAAEKIDRTQ